MTSASPSTWMPITWGDYLKNTMHLSAEEHGAYLLLIAHYWMKGGAIKNDKKIIENVTRISYKKCANILAFFRAENGLLIHDRIEDELSNAKENIEKQRARTSAATAARAQRNVERNEKKNHENTADFATTAPAPSPSPTLSNNPQTPKPVDKSGGVLKRRSSGYKVQDRLDDDGFALAKKSAPGWDIYHLAEIYNAKDEEVPRNPNKAFPAWCGVYTKGNPP